MAILCHLEDTKKVKMRLREGEEGTGGGRCVPSGLLLTAIPPREAPIYPPPHHSHRYDAPAIITATHAHGGAAAAEST